MCNIIIIQFFIYLRIMTVIKCLIKIIKLFTVFTIFQIFKGADLSDGVIIQHYFDSDS
jgi:hypothetical protein